MPAQKATSDLHAGAKSRQTAAVQAEEAAQGRQAQGGAAGVGAERPEDEPDDVPEVGVLGATLAQRHAPEADQGVVPEVLFAGFGGHLVGEQQFAVFGGEQEQESVNNS